MSYQIEQRKLLFWKKASLSDSLLVSTLATAMQKEMLAVASKYGISSLSLSRYEMKRRIWMSFGVVLTLL